MFTRKPASYATAREATPRKPPVHHHKTLGRPLAQEIESSSLQIADDYEQDCDPYNSTGQFCVIKTKQDD